MWIHGARSSRQFSMELCAIECASRDRNIRGGFLRKGGSEAANARAYVGNRGAAPKRAGSERAMRGFCAQAQKYGAVWGEAALQSGRAKFRKVKTIRTDLFATPHPRKRCGNVTRAEGAIFRAGARAFASPPVSRAGGKRDCLRVCWVFAEGVGCAVAAG